MSWFPEFAVDGGLKDSPNGVLGRMMSTQALHGVDVSENDDLYLGGVVGSFLRESL